MFVSVCVCAGDYCEKCEYFTHLDLYKRLALKAGYSSIFSKYSQIEKLFSLKVQLLLDPQDTSNRIYLHKM